MAVALGINNRVDEILAIAVQLKIVPKATDFFAQILAFPAYGGCSALNFFSHVKGRQLN
jgi:hypothetical protein